MVTDVSDVEVVTELLTSDGEDVGIVRKRYGWQVYNMGSESWKLN